MSDIVNTLLFDIEHYKKRIAELEAENDRLREWIPVEDELPKPHVEYVYIWPRPDFGQEIHTGMLTSKAEDPQLRWYVTVYQENWGNEMYEVKVTHWRPLPTPPLEDK